MAKNEKHDNLEVTTEATGILVQSSDVGTIYVGSTEPTGAEAGDLWIDTS